MESTTEHYLECAMFRFIWYAGETIFQNQYEERVISHNILPRVGVTDMSFCWSRCSLTAVFCMTPDSDAIVENVHQLSVVLTKIRVSKADPLSAASFLSVCVISSYTFAPNSIHLAWSSPEVSLVRPITLSGYVVPLDNPVVGNAIVVRIFAN